MRSVMWSLFVAAAQGFRFLCVFFSEKVLDGDAMTMDLYLHIRCFFLCIGF